MFCSLFFFRNERTKQANKSSVELIYEVLSLFDENLRGRYHVYVEHGVSFELNPFPFRILKIFNLYLFNQI